MSVTQAIETAKQQAKHLLEQLPDDATWDEIVYKFAVRRSIDRGLEDAAAGRTLSSEQLRTALRLD
jgi:hypothetical protein